MIKLFVSDLDDTLVYNVSHMHEEDGKALCWLAEKGTNICFASGRFTHRIHDAVRRFTFPYYTTGLNGATMLLPNGEIFHESKFDDGVAQEIYQYIHDKGLADIVCTKEKRYTKKKNEHHHAFEDYMGVHIAEIETLGEEFGKTVHPAKLFVYGEEEKIVTLDQELRETFYEQAEIFISGKRYVDIMPLGVSKGSALKRLMEHLKIEAHEVACIGDSFNDISMFAVTPHSFTLHHAHPYVKGKAHHIVRSVEEAIMKLPLLI
ncbi:HAD family hydrolase [Bacillus pseudomycoides]|uniref:HAD family hydrolase n=2 Tax=Bacillaceae TaxID=186817 RepID=A0AA91ZSZ9_9BACI|nr:HAD family hydrolase [Bacillus sp. AFS098217]PED82240.1 HAD family hydrolase [Bacillus pseudomycoides]PEU13434.1 HAD family hydrolase [Bacillus sp. AFS014408]PEU14560.1 HAD family hydrolase [Bacillus sp. AFS019443]PFW61704.1 HAD family hydrolase [Bacillus sp. AFS075034]